MRWTERQRAMLREMGIAMWQPPGEAVADGAAAESAAADGPAPATAAAPPVPRMPAPLPPVAEPAVRPNAGPPQAQTVPPQAVAEPPARAAALTHGLPATAPSDASVASAPSTMPGVESMDWTALRAAVAGCTACGLCQSRTQTVFGVGHERAHWMIVGEAPGEQEDLRGEPFVGPAGRLLDRMLLSLGLTRGPADAPQQVYIANTLKCRPPRNRNPEPQELRQCQPYLERQVALVQPRVIVAMGRFAVQSLLGSDEPIGRLRGRVHAWRGHPLVVTYHPAYLLRQPGEKARAWADLCLAASVVDRLADAAPTP
ncbi:uracil-DNA glycosylase [Ideonella sp. A 288]|uniref:uracil-DNA glycosylase n=1 Tax=Ideonella sp. A 288 TaxID=1962181 RepID=UPI000B4B8863|nr:uracil-DNA glycosylase [Ideonella sp. A 288]